jgi:hypothetical protein
MYVTNFIEMELEGRRERSKFCSTIQQQCLESNAWKLEAVPFGSGGLYVIVRHADLPHPIRQQSSVDNRDAWQALQRRFSGHA